jgi:CheY-like chemotaxis protein
VHELRPDVVVSDISMPGMDGLDLLAALRSEPATRDVPVVFLSGDLAGLRSRLAEDPSLALVPKPFEQAHLIEVVESFLTRRESSGIPAHEESSAGA